MDLARDSHQRGVVVVTFRFSRFFLCLFLRYFSLKEVPLLLMCSNLLGPMVGLGCFRLVLVRINMVLV